MPDYKLLVIMLVLFFSCADKESTAAPPDTGSFFKVYSTFLELSRTDSSMTDESVLMDSALSLHSMDAATFDSTLAYFEKHPDVFLDAFEKFDSTLRTEQGKTRAF